MTTTTHHRSSFFLHFAVTVLIFLSAQCLKTEAMPTINGTKINTQLTTNQAQNKTISQLVKEQTDAIKKIVASSLPANSAPAGTATAAAPLKTDSGKQHTQKENNDANLKSKEELKFSNTPKLKEDQSKKKEEKERLSIEDLRLRCQHFFKFGSSSSSSSDTFAKSANNNDNNKETAVETTTAKSEKIATVEAFGPQIKPDFLNNKKQVEPTTSSSLITKGYYIFPDSLENVYGNPLEADEQSQSQSQSQTSQTQNEYQIQIQNQNGNQNGNGNINDTPYDRLEWLNDAYKKIYEDRKNRFTTMQPPPQTNIYGDNKQTQNLNENLVNYLSAAYSANYPIAAAGNLVHHYSSQGSLQNSQGNLQNSQGSLQNSQGNLQNSQGSFQNSQGNLQNSQGSLQNLQGNLQNSQGNLPSSQNPQNSPQIQQTGNLHHQAYQNQNYNQNHIQNFGQNVHQHQTYGYSNNLNFINQNQNANNNNIKNNNGEFVDKFNYLFNYQNGNQPQQQAINSMNENLSSVSQQNVKFAAQYQPVVYRKTLLSNGQNYYYWYHAVPNYGPEQDDSSDSTSSSSASSSDLVYARPLVFSPQETFTNIKPLQKVGGEVATTLKTTTIKPTTSTTIKTTTPIMPVYEVVYKIEPTTTTTTTTTTERPGKLKSKPEKVSQTDKDKDKDKPVQNQNPVYKSELRFVLPMPLPAYTNLLQAYPYHVDPYAYYPKNLQPNLMNIQVPYVPTFHMIRTLAIPESNEDVNLNLNPKDKIPK